MSGADMLSDKDIAEILTDLYVNINHTNELIICRKAAKETDILDKTTSDFQDMVNDTIVLSRSAKRDRC